MNQIEPLIANSKSELDNAISICERLNKETLKVIEQSKVSLDKVLTKSCSSDELDEIRKFTRRFSRTTPLHCHECRKHYLLILGGKTMRTLGSRHVFFENTRVDSRYVELEDTYVDLLTLRMTALNELEALLAQLAAETTKLSRYYNENRETL